MPARKDLHSILVIGSGPIVIGQACEFDYSGNQAIQALKEEGYRVIVHNPNPASVMTIADSADAVYMEPLDIDHLCKIIEVEKPDAILPTMGGQSALNLAMEFDAAHSQGKLDDAYKVEFIGASIRSIKLAEDRGLFKEKMKEIGLESPFSQLVRTEFEAYKIAEEIGFPLIIRPSFTLGGQGGGIVYNSGEFRNKIRRALAISPVHTALIEESLLGYQEFEFEVVRDKNDNALVVCAIENFDPMGIHTGDSITVAPIQTLSDKEYQELRTASIEILRAVEVECGGSNVQLAYHPQKKRLLVIEMNPRVSRSSALASKATGYPIARCAAKLAVGFTLEEISNEITKKTTAFFEPSLDYVAVKVPRFDIKKFKIKELGTQMRSVGESLALSRTFASALNKALRAVEIGVEGLDVLENALSSELDYMISTLHPKRIFAMYTLLVSYGDACLDELEKKTHIHPWFLHQLLQLALFERKLLAINSIENLDENILLEAKEFGFTDKKIAKLLSLTDWSPEIRTKNETSAEHNNVSDNIPENDRYTCIDIQKKRDEYAISPHYNSVDTCAGEFAAATPYFYSSYGELGDTSLVEQPAIAIIGSGPNRIGQGLEFDTCCTMASSALRAQGYKVVMINCNPETVSTDFNISDRLYIEPLHEEDVYEILKKEHIHQVIFQLGGQTPINMMSALEAQGIQVLGDLSPAIHEAEHRDLFSQLLKKIAQRQPPSKSATRIKDIVPAADAMGYPVLVRPSYVIGGQSMAIMYCADDLQNFLSQNSDDLKNKHILIDKFLELAIEYDVDAISDGKNVYIGGVLKHIEHAGIHSGDSACVFTDKVGEDKISKEIYLASWNIARTLGGGVKGLLNIQFAVCNDELYIIEVNPRASRTIPFISKASGVNMIEMATAVWLGKSLEDLAIFQERRLADNACIAVGCGIAPYAVKEAVFSFDRFEEMDPQLTPEMRSTGESVGIGKTFGEAFAKASAAAGSEFPTEGTVFVSVTKRFRDSHLLSIIDALVDFGFRLIGTRGTAQFLNEHGKNCQTINRVADGSPHVIDEIESGKIDFMINIIKGISARATIDDQEIRTAGVKNNIPYVSTIAALEAAIEGIAYIKSGKVAVRPLAKIPVIPLLNL